MSAPPAQDDAGGALEHRLTEDQAADLLINWELAEQTAGRLAPAGPRLRASEAAEEVAALRTAAEDAVGHVHRITGLEAARELGTGAGGTLVVDRRGWTRANAASFRELLGPALAVAVERKPELAGKAGDGQKSSTQLFGSAVTGAELGGILGFLSSKVLGQFEPFQQDRLMLVAPNIVEVQRELNVVPEDFRLWVCLHEQTHRVQFAAAPWLADHMRERITELSTSMMGQADSLPERLAEAARQLKEEVSGRRRSQDDAGAASDGAPAGTGAGAADDADSGKDPEAAQPISDADDEALQDHAPRSSDQDKGAPPEDPAEAAADDASGTPDRAEVGSAAQSGGGSASKARQRLLEAIQSPEDRARMSHLTAVMSLLEGHANVVMDAVDSSVVPTVKTIRRRFEERGKNRSPLENLIRRLLQLDVKAAQYRDGQKFVGHIVEAEGMERFNRIWQSPEHLPTEEELHDPDAWIARVLG